MDTHSPGKTSAHQLLVRLLVGAVVLSLSAACGPKGGGGGNGVNAPPAEDSGPADTTPDVEYPPTRDASDVGVTDTADIGSEVSGDVYAGDLGDGGGECGGKSCGMDEVCQNQQCVKLGKVKCMSANDQGSLSPGGSLKIEGSFEGMVSDGLETSCAGTSQVPERVYSFSVTDDSLLNFTSNFPGNFDAKIEFRLGDCFGPDSGNVACRDRDRRVWVPGGETVYMIVENDVGDGGDFSVDLTAEAAACNPNTYSCDSQQDLQYCQWKNQTATPITFGCPDTCSQAECSGTTCGNAITVNKSKTYSGDLEAFQAKKNFEHAKANCNVGQNNNSVPSTAGPEVIFKVPMQAGETLDVDTTGDERDNVIFITETCPKKVSMASCLASTDDEKLTGWSAPSSGTYYVIVDKWSIAKGNFNYELRIE